ncbi:MAG TPA: hypothetical protein VIK78_10235 [Ruminiclostridium sp.]
MEGFFAEAGIFLITFFIIFIIKKINDYSYNKRSDGFGENSIYILDKKVFKAAREFAKGASNEEIEKSLLKCIDFDEEDADEILSMAEKHKSDIDGGYSSFLKDVNKILGEEVYCIACP